MQIFQRLSDTSFYFYAAIFTPCLAGKINRKQPSFNFTWWNMELQILISRLSFSVSLSNTPQAYMFWQVKQLKLINFLTETDSRYSKKINCFGNICPSV